MKPKIKVGICGLGRAGRQMHAHGAAEKFRTLLSRNFSDTL